MQPKDGNLLKILLKTTRMIMPLWETLEACLFELSWNLVGLEKFLMDMYMNVDYITLLLDRIEEYSTECGKRMIEMGADMIWAGDDFGTQKGMMLSPELWRKFF